MANVVIKGINFIRATLRDRRRHILAETEGYNRQGEHGRELLRRRAATRV